MKAKKQENPNLFKRDKRRSFDGTVVLKDKDLDEVMLMPDEYIQSMFAAYIPETGIIKSSYVYPVLLRDIKSEKNWRERIGVSEAGRYNGGDDGDLAKNLCSSLYWAMSKVESIERVAVNHPDIYEKLYRITSEEFERIKCDSKSKDFFSLMLDLTLVKAGCSKYNTQSESYKFFLDYLGDNMDYWTEIITNGKRKHVREYRRFVPASEEFGTPALWLYHNTLD